MERKWIQRRRDPRQTQLYRLATEHVHLPASLRTAPRGRGTVWGIAVVKNEADVVRLTLLHQLAQDIDAILVADNGSTDGTLDVLRDLAGEYPVHVAEDTWPAHYHGIKATYLADVARRAGAAWVVPFDADEFWFATGATVGQFLRTADGTSVRARIYNMFPFDSSAVTAETVFRLDRAQYRLQKVAFRPHPRAFLADGNHDVTRSGRRTEGLRIAHFPWRSFDQMQRKAIQGAQSIAATDLATEVCGHWRALAAEPTPSIAERWQKVMAGEPVADLGWGPHGPFVAAAPLSWRTWDPEGVLAPAGTARPEG